MPAKYDIAVVGGGVIGLSSVLHLRERYPEHEIVLIDAPQSSGVASLAAGGFLAPYAEFKESTPLFFLARESYDYFKEFLSRFKLNSQRSPIVDVEGVLIPVNPYEQVRAQKIAEHASKYIDVEKLDRKALSVAEPHLNVEACRSAYRLPGAMIDSILLRKRMAAAVRKAGVHIIRGKVSGLDARNGIVTSVRIDKTDPIRAGTVLICTGVWSKALGDLIDLDVDVIPVKGQVARFQIEDGFLNHVLHAHEVCLGPRRGKGIVVGATMEFVGFDKEIVDEAIANLCHAASKYVPALWDQELTESSYGFRPKLPDGNPVMGWSSKFENLMIATGHFRNGILLSPITGKIMADLYRQPENKKYSAFSPVRLGI